MKKKVNIIWCCDDCSHCEKDVEPPSDGYCRVMGTHLDDASIFPEWCPLEDISVTQYRNRRNENAKV